MTPATGILSSTWPAIKILLSNLLKKKKNNNAVF